MAPRKANAHTLIELVVVLAILAILAAVVAPRWASATMSHRAARAAYQVAADLRYARQTAINRAATVTVRFDLATSRVTVEGAADLDHRASDHVSDLAGEPFHATLIDASFGGDGVVIFNGYGDADSGGTVTLQCGRFTKVVTLTASSGEASVQ